MTPSSYYLESFLAPLKPWLSRRDVTDIWINRPEEIWVEKLSGGIECAFLEGLSEDMLARIARQIAAGSSQGINRTQPLLSATLPDGSRVQIVGPPATRSGYVMAFRRHVASDLTLSDWEQEGAFEAIDSSNTREMATATTYKSVEQGKLLQVLHDAVRSRRNILISGGTSTGKTTFLNALLAAIPDEERLILIEDTAELRLRHENSVGLIAARGDLAEARVSVEDLLIAALRLRPDRIILGELRGMEAFSFLRAINTGHPGSMTTIHADSPRRAIEQLALLVLQAGSRLSREDVRLYVQESIDVFVQLDRRFGKRFVSQVLVADREGVIE